MANPLVSVIIPVYNVEAFLERCVRSVLEQTYPELEVLLIDDGSTDGSGALCDALAQTDARILVLHKPNGGLSDARNCGIEAARGDWLTFLDSDDALDLAFVQTMVDAARQQDAELVICDYLRMDEADVPLEEPYRHVEAFTADGFSAYEHDYGHGGVQNTIACAKLYARELIGTTRFPVGKLHEDEYITYQWICRARRVCYVAQQLYRYRVRQGSIMTKRLTRRNLDAAAAYEERIRFFEENGRPLAKKKTVEQYCLALMYWAENCPGEAELIREVDRLQKAFRERFRKLLSLRLRFGLMRRVIAMKLRK